MVTNFLPIIINKTKDTFSVKMNRHSMERLADSLGLYNDDFLASITRAETDIKAGRVKKLRSLRDLRSA